MSLVPVPLLPCHSDEILLFQPHGRQRTLVATSLSPHLIKEVISDMDLTFHQNKKSFKCQYCRPSSRRLSSSSYKGQINTQSSNSLSWFSSVPCSVLKDHPGSSQLQSLGHYLDFSLAGGARKQWPCHQHWSAVLWLVRRFLPSRTGRSRCCQAYVRVSGDRIQPCWQLGSDGRSSARHSHPHGSTDTRHSRRGKMVGHVAFSNAFPGTAVKWKILMFLMGYLWYVLTRLLL